MDQAAKAQTRIDYGSLQAAISATRLRLADATQNVSANTNAIDSVSWVEIIASGVSGSYPVEPPPERMHFKIVLARKSRGGPAKSNKPLTCTPEM
jgi:phenolic acid decarboxylase